MIALVAKGSGSSCDGGWDDLPIVMLAMLVQIFAPIAACLTFSPITADPLVGAIYSHRDPSFAQDRGTNPQQTHGACCVVHRAAASPPPTRKRVAVRSSVTQPPSFGAVWSSGFRHSSLTLTRRRAHFLSSPELTEPNPPKCFCFPFSAEKQVMSIRVFARCCAA